MENITKEEFYCPEMDIHKTELCNLNKLAFYDSFLEREVIFYHCECNRTFDADLCETSQYNNLL